ncbi:hypothetical protein EVAR_54995_1 [Eumeta japonica]|uniref:Uncharacterized protein n=1 Tax=Eumeta variegata TaxID=151549 RepID=A0A4C1Z3S9_EUMVA|nr:hypothetical protein EVAR_54995_1 [Eumeta japonica]
MENINHQNKDILGQERAKKISVKKQANSTDYSETRINSQCDIIYRTEHNFDARRTADDGTAGRRTADRSTPDVGVARPETRSSDGSHAQQLWPRRAVHSFENVIASFLG